MTNTEFDQFGRQWLPDGPAAALAHTQLVCTSMQPEAHWADAWVTHQGQPLMIHLLNGRLKTLICPWYGDIDKDPMAFCSERGDGRPIYAEPDSDLFCATPNWPPRNIRTGVPLWVLQSPSPEALRRGVARTLAVGLFHPLLSAATLDVYRQKLTGRIFAHDPRLSHEERADQKPEWMKRQWEEQDCEPGHPMTSPPTWRPRCSQLLR